MQKKLIALAITAAFASAPAFADVNVYGIMDAGVYSNDSGAASNSKTSGIASSGYTTSRLGFKGTEDLGNGISARYQLEAEVVPTSGQVVSKSLGTTGTMNFFKRAATVGLVGDYGSVDIGRQNTPEYATLGGFDSTGGSNTGGLVPFYGSTSTDRVDNSMLYTSPNMSGFKAQLLYSSMFTSGNTESSATTSAGNFYNYQVAYAAGPISAALGGQHANNSNPLPTVAAPGTLYSNIYIMGKYDFGMASVAAGYINRNNEVSGSDNTKHTWIGVNVPVTSVVVVGAVVQKIKSVGGTTGNDATGYGLVGTYALNKHAKLYAAYSGTNNKGTASVGDTVATGGTFGVAAGKSGHLMMAGLNYSF